MTLLIALPILLLIFHVLNSLGIMKLAKKNKVENSWLALLPIANMYLLGKLGFEIYAEEGKKNSNFAIIMMILSFIQVITFFFIRKILSINIEFIDELSSMVLYVFTIFAYSNIYKMMLPNEVTKYTVLSALFGGIPLLISADKIIAAKDISQKTFNEKTLNLENQDVQNEQNNLKKGDLREQKSDEKSKNESNFCSSCGAKLTETAKFCSNCGKEIK